MRALLMLRDQVLGEARIARTLASRMNGREDRERMEAAICRLCETSMFLIQIAEENNKIRNEAAEKEQFE